MKNYFVRRPLTFSVLSPSFLLFWQSSYALVTRRGGGATRQILVATMSSSTSSTSSIAGSSLQGFHGRIVARTLPVGITPDEEMRYKPVLHRIDPSTLIPGSGPLHYRPTMAATMTTTSVEKEEERGEDNATTVTTDPLVAKVKEPQEQPLAPQQQQQWTTLQVFLFDENKNSQNNDGDNDSTTIFFQMNRASEESLAKTLKRLQITLSKKLLEQQAAQAQRQYNDSNPKKKPQSLSEARKQLAETVIETAFWNVETAVVDNDGSTQVTLKEPWKEEVLNTTSNTAFWNHISCHPTVLRIRSSVVQNETQQQQFDLALEYNPPTVWGVKTFCDFESYLYVGIPVVVELDLLFCDSAEICWFVNNTLVQQSESRGYIPTEANIGGTLSVLIRPVRPQTSHSGSGCEEAYTFSKRIQSPPENYLLTLRPRWTFNRDACSRQDHIRVLTYNILADQNAFEASGKPGRFYASYVSAEILRKQRRLPLIAHEILAYQADIVCLQEVDRGIFHRLLEPTMKFCGYEGYYSGKGEELSEGCAMFYSLDKFESVPEGLRETVKIRDVMPVATVNEGEDDIDNDGWHSTKSIAQLFRERPDLGHLVHTTLGHVFQMICLKPRRDDARDYTPLPIWVCNTHLFFHPQASHVRALQMYALCRKLARSFDDEPSDDDDNDRQSSSSVIICGDFNANLTDPAGRLLLQRHVPLNEKYLKLDLNRFTWNRRAMSQRYTTDFPALYLPPEEHVFPTMRSALSEAAPVTHFIKGFAGTLDHILVGGDTLQPVRHAPLPSRRDLGRHTAMPSEFLPSDHVSLVADLKLVH